MIFFPRINEKSTVKDLVVVTLTQQWPLSAKEIYFQLKKEHNVSVTYQAVHKVLQMLIDKNILTIECKKYQLNKDWINLMTENFNNLKKSYFNKNKFDKNVIPSKLVFQSYYEMYSFMADLIYEEQIDPKGLPICFTDKHWWNLFILTEEQLMKLEEFSKRLEFYCIAKCGTPLDLILMNFYKKHGMHCMNSDKIKTDQGIVIMGDFFIQIFYPNNLQKVMDEIANSTKNMETMDLKKMHHELVFKKNEIILLLHHDQQMAERMRKEVIGYFCTEGKK
jgi:hypothetical protein